MKKRYFVLALIALLAQAAAAGSVYVVNEGGNSVSVIDLDTNVVTGTISVGSGPSYIARNKSGTKVYIANTVSNTVNVIDTALKTVVATITGLMHPVGIAVSPDESKAYVTSLTDNVVYVLDLHGNAVSTTIATSDSGGALYGVAFKPDGILAYVTDAVHNKVFVIDAAVDEESGFIPVGTQPKGVAFSMDGKKAYVVNSGSSNVSVINVEAALTEALISVPISPTNTAVSPNGVLAYITDASGDDVGLLVGIDVPRNAVGNTISVFGSSRATGLSFTDDGSYIYVTSHDSSTVSAINVSLQKVVHNIEAGSGPLGLVAIGSRTVKYVGAIQKINRFANQTEVYNVVSWDRVQDEVFGYSIYRDRTLTKRVAFVGSVTSEFEDHNLEKHKSYSYYIVAHYIEGTQEMIGSVTLNP